jgi:hypothetical protein
MLCNICCDIWFAIEYSYLTSYYKAQIFAYMLGISSKMFEGPWWDSLVKFFHRHELAFITYNIWDCLVCMFYFCILFLHKFITMFVAKISF